MSFQKFVEKLKENRVPCTVFETEEGEVIAECGFNYPDELYFQIDEIAEECNISKVSVNAETSHRNVDRIRIAGGPKRY